ncbi:cyclopropane-fatty-acyl-phospholipid synthase [Fusarium denticulatum]|uniref:Cyclopropane-fatty-acyl-phospholipid synthase n=1 Tax=Fusarium denticulatum TaxID=48507 RepID=A0A8H5TPQ3_9HYPO|nr:cyclopropane-fatty-acyl-phospholipid synthase [Fusarium denticulatum]
MSERITTPIKLDPAAALLWHPPGDKIAFLDEFPFPRLRSPILDATLACRHSFRSICFTRHSRSKWAEENLISFNAWSVSSGAGVWGEFSLDDKLVTRRQDSCILRNLLWMLDDFVNAVGRIGKYIPHTSTHAVTNNVVFISNTGGSAEESNVQGAESVLKQLFTLTTDFLRSLPLTHPWDSESSFGDEADEDLVSFKLTLLSEYDPLLANADEGRVSRVSQLYEIDWLKQTQNGVFVSRKPGSGESNLGQALRPSTKGLTLSCHLQCLLVARSPREHVMADLAPFTCVVSDCQHPNLFFTSEFDWRSHVERVHGEQRWTCYYCDPSISFDSLKALRTHLEAKQVDKVHAAALKLKDSEISSETASWQIDKPLECPFCPEVTLREHSLDHIAKCLLGFAMKALLYNDTDFHRASTGVPVLSVEASDAVDSTVFTMPVEKVAVPIDLLGTEGQPVPDRPQTISPGNLIKTPTGSKRSSTTRPKRGGYHGRRSAARTTTTLVFPQAVEQASALPSETAMISDGPPTKRRKLSEDDLDTRISYTSSVMATINGSGLSGSTGRIVASGNTTMRTQWGWESCYPGYTGKRYHKKRSMLEMEKFERVEKHLRPRNGMLPSMSLGGKACIAVIGAHAALPFSLGILVEHKFFPSPSPLVLPGPAALSIKHHPAMASEHSYILVLELGQPTSQIAIGNIFRDRRKVDQQPFAGPGPTGVLMQLHATEHDVDLSFNISKRLTASLKAKLCSFLGIGAGFDSSKEGDVALKIGKVETYRIAMEGDILHRYVKRRVEELNQDAEALRRLRLDPNKPGRLFMITGVKVATDMERYVAENRPRGGNMNAGFPLDPHQAAGLQASGAMDRNRNWSVSGRMDGPVVIAYQLYYVPWKNDKAQVEKNLKYGMLGDEKDNEEDEDEDDEGENEDLEDEWGWLMQLGS